MSKKSANKAATGLSALLSLSVLAFLVWQNSTPLPAPMPHPEQPPKTSTPPVKAQTPVRYRLPAPPQITTAQKLPVGVAQETKVDLDAKTETDPAKAHVIQPTDHQQGRTLLRFLEHGKGPQIELAWPPSPQDRAALYRHLAACFGMISAILDADGRLWRLQDPTHQEWALNLDHYSGFLRHVSGRLSPTERDIFRQINQRHAVTGQQVRLFPRAVDAALLGGISAALGPRYHQSQTIRARYHLHNDQVHIDSINADDDAYPQSFLLPTLKGC